MEGSRWRANFQKVLSAAIADLIEHGFDSMERIDRWTRELRVAAEQSLISPKALEQQLRDGLAAIYRKMVDQGQVAKFHPGVARFTLERVRPALRAELDRRIMASADLIKLNRAQAIDKALQRFQGWSTSIPAGGVSGEARAKVKTDVRKALAQLPFEERRVLIDQGHKLTAAISNIIAVDGGAVAATWHSHWRQPGYNYREDHKERDGQVYLLRDSWAQRAGLVKKGAAGYYDEVTAVGQEPFCRCYLTYLYNLRDLPDEMRTAKGRATLADVQARLRADDADDAAPPSRVPAIVDRDHDVAWMAVISRDGSRLYVDRTLPRRIEIKGRRVDPAELLWAHEFAEWELMLKLLAAFLDHYLRQPNEAERVAIYLYAHEHGGIPAERAAARRLRVDWDGWEAWSRGELARLEHRPVASPPSDPHVKPAPHDRREPMEALAA